MVKILGGILLIFLGYAVNIGGYAFDITPDFIGALLIYLALKDFDFIHNELEDIEKKLKLLIVFFGVGTIITAFAGNLDSQSLIATLFSTTWSLIYFVATLYITYLAISILTLVETNRNCDFKTTKLNKHLRRLAILYITVSLASGVVLLILSTFSSATTASSGLLLFSIIFLLFMVVMSILTLIVEISILVLFYKAMKTYNNLDEQVIEGN